MALNLGRGGVQELGGGQANALLQNQSNLRSERVQDARATAAFQLEQAKEASDALGISMADYAKQNPGQIQGALATLYGGGADARGRAAVSFEEITNGPRSMDQIENFARMTQFDEEYGDKQYLDRNPETRQTMTEAATEARAASFIDPSTGQPVDEAIIADKEASFQRLLQGGDSTAASLLSMDYRDNLSDWVRAEAEGGNAWAQQMAEKLDGVGEEINEAGEVLRYGENRNKVITEILQATQSGNIPGMEAGGTGGGGRDAQAQVLSRDQRAFGEAITEKYKENPVVMRQFEKIFERVPEERHEQVRRFFMENSKSPENYRSNDEAFGFEGKTMTEYLRGLLPDESVGGNSLFDPKLWRIDLPEADAEGEERAGPPPLEYKGYQRVDAQEASPAQYETTYHPDDILTGRKEYEDLSAERGGLTSPLNEQVEAQRMAIAERKMKEELTDLYGAQQAQAYGNLELAYQGALTKANSLDPKYGEVAINEAKKLTEAFMSYRMENDLPMPTAADIKDSVTFTSWFDGLRPAQQRALSEASDKVFGTALYTNPAMREIFNPTTQVYKGGFFGAGKDTNVTIPFPQDFNMYGGAGAGNDFYAMLSAFAGGGGTTP